MNMALINKHLLNLIRFFAGQRKNVLFYLMTLFTLFLGLV